MGLDRSGLLRLQLDLERLQKETHLRTLLAALKPAHKNPAMLSRASLEGVPPVDADATESLA